jgi:DNA-binding PadR family transcriptional regulator
MSLEHAILGFLNYKPFSGYDLKKVFDISVRHFWPADQSQIYRTLARLADKNLVELEVVEQADRPDRKVYHITEDGQAELDRWLSTPLRFTHPRNDQLIQVFFSGQLNDDETLAMFERQAGHLRTILGSYDQIPKEAKPYMDMVGSPRESFFWMLTLECGVEAFRAQLAWLESVIERIKDGHIPPE